MDCLESTRLGDRYNFLSVRGALRQQSSKLVGAIYSVFA